MLPRRDLAFCRIGLGASLLTLSLVGSGSAQLPFVEGFETDGDGSRYTVTDPGFVADTGDAGPAMWGRAVWSADTRAPTSLEGASGPIGLAQAAPAKRAAILWETTLTEDDISAEAFQVWASLIDWAVGGKTNANVGFFPPESPDSILYLIAQGGSHNIVDVSDSANLPDPSELDLLIHTNAGSPVPPIAFTDYAVPVIAFEAANHDDTAIAGIGDVLDFTGAATLTISDTSHPALTGAGPIPDSIFWTQVPAMLQGVGKAHGGGTVLATVENPTTGNEDPAIFVIEEGAGLLGTFDPPPTEGEIFFAGAALNKFGSAAERRLELMPIDLGGAENVQLAISLAATDADFENGDYLNIWIDTQGAGEFQQLANYVGATEPAAIRGALQDTMTEHVLTSNEFQDRVFDIPADAATVILRFDALNTWGNEIVGIDNIRIFSLPESNCDFDGDGVCGISDLDALLYDGQQNQTAIYDLNGDGTVDLADRDEWLSQAGTKETGQTYPPGDFNLSNKTDAGDLNILGISWQKDVSSYSQGDTNGDGVANAADLNTVGIHWQETGTAAAATAAVPEPALSWVAVLGCLAFCRRFVRRRRI